MTTITIQKTSGDAALKSLQVTVPTERVRQAEDRAVQQVARKVRLPGFRAGHAPAAIVRKKFHDAIRQSVLDEVIRESWDQARESESLKPVADPSVRNVKFDEGGAIEFELHVEVRPEVTVTTLGGFTLTRQVPEVTDAQLDEQIGRLREQKATWLPVEGQRPSAGQMVQVDVASLDEGDAAAAQPHSIVLGEGQALPALEERIMELQPGETAEAEVRLPEDHPDESRRGKVRKLRVTLHEVKRQELPPLDDAFAREVGDFNDLAALQSAVRADLEQDALREADARVRDQLIQKLVEANGIEAPPSLVHRVIHGYLHAYGVPHEKEPEFAAQFQPVAEAQVRRDMVLSAVAEAQALYATEADVDARIATMAAARNVPAGQVYASLQKAKRLAELERAITEDKVFGYLLQQSTVEG
ncbi:MAG TPA: trigger factor [Gemmatimonadales bacterium]|nr:trigger factor [Gemmatimonadales bacterium]